MPECVVCVHIQCMHMCTHTCVSRQYFYKYSVNLPCNLSLNQWEVAETKFFEYIFISISIYFYSDPFLSQMMKRAIELKSACCCGGATDHLKPANRICSLLMYKLNSCIVTLFVEKYGKKVSHY